MLGAGAISLTVESYNSGFKLGWRRERRTQGIGSTSGHNRLVFVWYISSSFSYQSERQGRFTGIGKVTAQLNPTIRGAVAGRQVYFKPAGQ